jgi:hypothetical protein
MACDVRQNVLIKPQRRQPCQGGAALHQQLEQTFRAPPSRSHQLLPRRPRPSPTDRDRTAGVCAHRRARRGPDRRLVVRSHSAQVGRRSNIASAPGIRAITRTRNRSVTIAWPGNPVALDQPVTTYVAIGHRALVHRPITIQRCLETRYAQSPITRSRRRRRPRHRVGRSEGRCRCMPTPQTGPRPLSLPRSRDAHAPNDPTTPFQSCNNCACEPWPSHQGFQLSACC